jgi:hypothetical protein
MQNIEPGAKCENCTRSTSLLSIFFDKSMMMAFLLSKYMMKVLERIT